jgi:hypothetical protein
MHYNPVYVNPLSYLKIANFALCVRFAIKMVKVRAARLACVVYVIVAVRRHKTVARELLALAHNASAAACYHVVAAARLS